jgi:hypothetical protein
MLLFPTWSSRPLSKWWVWRIRPTNQWSMHTGFRNIHSPKDVFAMLHCLLDMTFISTNIAIGKETEDKKLRCLPLLSKISTLITNQGSVVNTSLGYTGWNDGGTELRFPAEARDFPSLQSVQTGSVARQDVYKVRGRALFPQISSGRGGKLNTHPNLVPKLRMRKPVLHSTIRLRRVHRESIIFFDTRTEKATHFQGTVLSPPTIHKTVNWKVYLTNGCTGYLFFFCMYRPLSQAEEHKNMRFIYWIQTHKHIFNFKCAHIHYVTVSNFLGLTSTLEEVASHLPDLAVLTLQKLISVTHSQGV